MNFLIGLFNAYYKTFFGPGFYTHDWIDYTIGSIIGLAVLIVVGVLTYLVMKEVLWLVGPYRYKYSKVKIEEGKVVGLDFHHSHTSTGVGPTFGSNGGVAVTTSYIPEEDNVIIKSEIFGKLIVDDEDLFNAVEPGDKVKIYYVDKIKYNRKDPHEKTEVVDYVAQYVEFKGEEYSV